MIIFVISLASYLQWKGKIKQNVLNSYDDTIILNIIRTSYHVYTVFARRPITALNFVDEASFIVPFMNKKLVRTIFTLAFISGAFIVSVFAPDLVFIMSLVRSTSVPLTMFIVPATMYIIVKSNPHYQQDIVNGHYSWKERFFKKKKWLAWILIIIIVPTSILAIVNNALTLT